MTLTGATLISLIASALSLSLPQSFPKVTDPSVASGFLLFGMVFLTIWTIGGIAAGTHLFRSVAGEDRVWLTSEFLVIHRRAWVFRRTTRVPRHDIRRISMTDRDRALAVYSSRGLQTITTLGTIVERRALRTALMGQLTLPDAAAVRELEQHTVPPSGRPGATISATSFIARRCASFASRCGRRGSSPRSSASARWSR